MRHFLAVVAALAFHAAAQAQDNLQNLLAALTLGSEVTLVTPLANPTPEQLSIALSGGVLTTPVGAVMLQGVLAAGIPATTAGSAAVGGTAPPAPGFLQNR